MNSLFGLLRFSKNFLIPTLRGMAKNTPADPHMEPQNRIAKMTKRGDRPKLLLKSFGSIKFPIITCTDIEKTRRIKKLS